MKINVNLQISNSKNYKNLHSVSRNYSQTNNTQCATASQCCKYYWVKPHITFCGECFIQINWLKKSVNVCRIQDNVSRITS